MLHDREDIDVAGLERRIGGKGAKLARLQRMEEELETL